MVKTKKALIITYNPDHSLGGTELYAQKVIDILKKKNWDITEFSLDVRNERDKIKNADHLVLYASVRNSEKYNHKTLVNLKKSIKELATIKKENKYDLIVNNVVSFFSFEKPLKNEVLIQHNDLFYYSYGFIKPKWLRKLTLFFSKLFVGYIEGIPMQNNMVFFNKENQNKISTYYNKKFINSACISLSEYSKEEILNVKKKIKENKLVYIGRIEYHQKNLKFLIKLARHLDVQVDVYGNGEPSIIKKLQNAKNINFCGRAEHKNVLKIYSKYLASINVSKYEGFPYSCLESICAQTPCILRNTFTSASFFSKNNCGLLLDKKFSPKKCAIEINKWIRNADFEKLAKSNKQLALDELSWEKFEDRWSKFLKKF